MMESTTNTSALQAQIKEYATRIERLERHRALLMGKEREAEEKEKARRAEEDGGRAEMQAQARALRQELSALRDQYAELGASYRDLEHSSKQAISSSESQSARVAAVERELELARRDAAERAAELNEEREQSRAVEAELERAKAHGADAANAEVVREELHRQSPPLSTWIAYSRYSTQAKSAIYEPWRRKTASCCASLIPTSANMPTSRSSRSPTSRWRRRFARWTICEIR